MQAQESGGGLVRRPMDLSSFAPAVTLQSGFHNVRPIEPLRSCGGERTGSMRGYADFYLYFFTCVKYILHLCEIKVSSEELLVPLWGEN